MRPKRSPLNPKHLLVKRVVAVEGDTVKTLPPYPDFEVTIPQGHVWVEGEPDQGPSIRNHL